VLLKDKRIFVIEDEPIYVVVISQVLRHEGALVEVEMQAMHVPETLMTRLPVDVILMDPVCRNPYPCDFDYGLIYSMGRRFCQKNAQFTVYHDAELGCRKKGANSCTYHMIWKPA
jgi:hypothetical protein